MSQASQLFELIGKQAVTIDTLQRQLQCQQSDLQHLQEALKAKEAPPTTSKTKHRTTAQKD